MELDQTAKMNHDSQLKLEIKNLNEQNQAQSRQIDRLKGDLALLQEKYLKEKQQNKVELKRLKMQQRQCSTNTLGV